MSSTESKSFMSDVSVDVATLGELTNSFQQANTEFDAYVDTLGDFKVAHEPAYGYADYFSMTLVNKIVDALESTSLLAHAIQFSLNKYVETEDAADTAIATQSTDVPAPEYIPSGGGYVPSGNSSGSDTPSAPTTSTVPDEQAQANLIAAFDKTTLDGLAAVTDVLMAMAVEKNVALDALLSDANMAAEIKKQLLAINNLPDDIKKLLTDSSDEVVRKTLLAMYTGEQKAIFDSDVVSNLDIAKKHLASFAERNNTTTEAVLNDVTLTKKALQEFKDVADYMLGSNNAETSTLQINLNSVYNGTDVEGKTVAAIEGVRAFVDITAQNANVPVETLLTDASHGTTLNTGINSYGKTCKFFQALANVSDDKCKTIATALLK